MLRNLMAKVDNIVDGNISRETEILITNKKRSDKNKKHHNRNEKCFSWAYEQTGHR